MTAAIGKAGLIATWLAASTVASADGAFPDSMQIMTPSDKPHEIVLGTNFGLLVSEDDGTSWDFLCEEVVGSCARLYQMSAPPSDSITALTAAGLVVVSNGLCSRDLAQASFGGITPFFTDAFADPTDAGHVLAIGLTSMTSNISALYESRDRGRTFATELFEAPAGLVLTGVENARTAGQTIYLTGIGGGTANLPTILASTNGGTSFSTFDVSSTLGAKTISLAAVDRDDPKKLYLRVVDPMTGVNSLAISEDGGTSATLRLSLPAPLRMTAFLQMADGTLLVTGLNPGRITTCGPPDYTGPEAGAAYRSSDGGQHFDPWTEAPHVRALAERAGVLYVVANNFVDGYAVATTTDLGKHFTPILTFDRIGGPLACEQNACGMAWAALQNLFGIPDGGVTPMNLGSSCSCEVGRRGSIELSFVLALVIALFVRRSVAKRP